MTAYPEYLTEYSEATTRQEQEMKNTTKTDGPKPMEASIVPAAKVGTPFKNNERVCWAAKTLVAEVHEMFPETPVEYSNPDGRNTMLDVSFDLTVLDDHTEDGATALLELVSTDTRVSSVVAEHGQVLVSFKASARTQDNRDSFGLGDAWDVLTDGSVFDDGDYDVITEPPTFGRPVSLGFLTDGGSL